MVSVILIVEKQPAPAVEQALNDIVHQTYSDDDGIEVVIAMDTVYDLNSMNEIILKHSHKLNFKYVQGAGIDLLKKASAECEGRYIFYKTVGNNVFIPVWYPRHIEVALENITNKQYYGFSMIEYRNLQQKDQPFQVMYWRKENFNTKTPKKELMLLDEVWHINDKSVPLNYDFLVNEKGILDSSRFMVLFKDKRIKHSSEITVVVYTVPEILNTLMGAPQQPAQPAPPSANNNSKLEENNMLVL